MSEVHKRLKQVTDFDMIQIELAASGCVDKTLGDWAYLRSALLKLGIKLDPSTSVIYITPICQFIMDCYER